MENPKTYQHPRRFKFRLPDDIDRPFDQALRFGVYFPTTDLMINDMGGRGTGCPENVDWIDETETNF